MLERVDPTPLTQRLSWTYAPVQRNLSVASTFSEVSEYKNEEIKKADISFAINPNVMSGSGEGGRNQELYSQLE
jgi:hypothetical protein